MKRVVLALLLASVILIVCGYIYILTLFQGPIVADISDQVQYDSVAKEITLPWYLKFGSTELSQWNRNGIDKDGNSYTWFAYELSDLWEDAEMNCIVSWNDENAKLYVGEPRAMFCIDENYADVEWSFQ